MLMTRRRLARRRRIGRSWSLIGLAALSGLILSGPLVTRWRRRPSSNDCWLDASDRARPPQGQRQLWGLLRHLAKIQRQGRLRLVRLVSRPPHGWSGEDL